MTRAFSSSPLRISICLPSSNPVDTSATPRLAPAETTADLAAWGYGDHAGVGQAIRRVEQGTAQLQRTGPHLGTAMGIGKQHFGPQQVSQQASQAPQ